MRDIGSGVCPSTQVKNKEEPEHTHSSGASGCDLAVQKGADEEGANITGKRSDEGRESPGSHSEIGGVVGCYERVRPPASKENG